MKTIGRRSVASIVSVVLGLSWVSVLAGLVLAVCLTVALPFVPQPGMTVTVPVSFSLDTPTPVRVVRAGFGFEMSDAKASANDEQKGRIDRVDGSLKIPTTSRAFIAANAVVLIVILAFSLFVLGQLRAVFRTLTAGQPFVAANAPRIRWIAVGVIGGELARAAIVVAENHYAMTHVTVAGLRFDAWPHVNLFVLVNGLVLLVIAEVFRAGTRLDEEQSLTI
jgi:hypothetical protein